ncbi:hypothetical protein [Crossiella sp. CA198]|uniref:hypothetical protein n=1 Tax=Crossiella sp. CA198 TaxID=3455607 RepID=UPI003F8D1613
MAVADGVLAVMDGVLADWRTGSAKTAYDNGQHGGEVRARRLGRTADLGGRTGEVAAGGGEQADDAMFAAGKGS